MASRHVHTVIVLPWIAAAMVLMVIIKARDSIVPWHWGLFGSGAICFSIGCLARTSVALHDAKNDQHQ